MKGIMKLTIQLSEKFNNSIFNAPKIKITGTGSYLPSTVLTNEDIAKTVKTSDDWIFENLGIKERRIVENELTSDLATQAAKKAIEAASIDPEEIDCIILATSTPDRIAPSTACIVKNKLNIKNNCPAFDIAAVCSGFLYGLHLASLQIQSGVYRKILVVGADTFSKITDWTRRDCVFFGDGAGAAIIEKADGAAYFHSRIFTETTNTDNFTVFPGKKSFTMNAQAVYDTGTTVLPAAIKQVIKECNLQLDDISIIIPHQPSRKLLIKTAYNVGIDFSLFQTNMRNYANTSGGTVPIILDETVRAGKIKPNDVVVLAVVGAGWTWGAGVLKWS